MSIFPYDLSSSFVVLFTRGAWRDIWWLNHFLQANTTSQDVSSLGACLKKNVYLQGHHAVRSLEAPSRTATSPTSTTNLPSVLWDKERAKNVSDKITDLFLTPQTRDSAGSC